MTESSFDNSIEYKIQRVKEIIRRSLKENNSKFAELIDCLPADGGKLIRAVFVLLGGAFGKIDEGRLMNIAAAVEILHLATLVHDDIIDETETRRGKEAIHKKYSAKSALFAGDYLFAQSYVMFSKNCRQKSIEEVSKTIKFICKSEINQFFSLHNFDSSIRDYLKRINGKCASLFSLSLSIGAYEGNAEAGAASKLKAIGYYAGMAFQIIDDLLDFTSTKKVLGKPAGNDMKQGIYSMPVIYELRNGNEDLLRLIKEEKFENAISLIKNSEGFKKSKIVSEKYTNKALKYADELPEIPEREMLRELLQQLLVRNY